MLIAVTAVRSQARKVRSFARASRAVAPVFDTIGKRGYANGMALMSGCCRLHEVLLSVCVPPVLVQCRSSELRGNFPPQVILPRYAH